MLEQVGQSVLVRQLVRGARVDLQAHGGRGAFHGAHEDPQPVGQPVFVPRRQERARVGSRHAPSRLGTRAGVTLYQPSSSAQYSPSNGHNRLFFLRCSLRSVPSGSPMSGSSPVQAARSGHVGLKAEEVDAGQLDAVEQAVSSRSSSASRA